MWRDSQTLTKQGATHPGLVLGTAGYMSPEQVRGQRVDHRSDIFSFGAVVYEMLSGQRAFTGASTVETLNAILANEPPEPPVAGAAPALQRVWQHCLDKSPEHRFQSARDIAFALEGVTDSSGATPAVAGRFRRSNHAAIAWTTAGFFMLATAALAYVALRHQPPDVRPVRFEVRAPDGGSFQSILGISSAISPDGRSLAMIVTAREGTRLFVRNLDSTVAQALDGTDGASSPFWSPDSQWIAFFADGVLRKVKRNGGTAQPICRMSSRMAGPWQTGAWGSANIILFRSSAGFLKVPADGGEPTPIPGTHVWSWWPAFLPDGHTFLFMTVGLSGPSEIRIGSLDSTDTQVLLPADSRAVYAAPGYLLYVRESTLMAQRFDPTSKRLSGEPQPVAEDLLYFRDLGESDFSVSNDGVLAYQAGPTASRLVWFDRDGIETGQVGVPAHFTFLRLSANARKVAVDILDRRRGTTDIWFYDLARSGDPSRVTLDAKADWTPVFSPDGNQLAFASAQRGAPHVHVKNLTESSDLQQVVPPSTTVQFVSDWVQSPEGGYIIYVDQSSTGIDLMRVPMFGDRKPLPLVQTAADETSGVASSDGKLLAYVSNESGRSEVYLRAMSGTTRQKVSTGGGVSPRWRSDGRELYYVATWSTMVFGATAPDARLMAVTVSADGVPGIPVPLFTIRARGSQYNTKDGKRFLVNFEDVSSALPITVDLDWTRQLRR